MFDFLKKRIAIVKVEPDHERPYAPLPVKRSVIPAGIRQPQKATSCFLKNGFCCVDGECHAKCVAVNHVSALYHCDKKECQKFLVKAEIRA